MPIQIQNSELPRDVRESVTKEISNAISDGEGFWQVKITSEPKANAWDVEVQGPYEFHWARRFSGEDRDADVISEAIRSAVVDRAA